MSITDTVEKIKSRVSPFYTLILLILVSLIFFCLGRLSALESQHTPIKITYPENTISTTNTDSKNQTASAVKTLPPQPSTRIEVVASTTVNGTDDGPVIGSKSGKKYYFPWCGTVKRILPENQVHFASIADARTAGFLPGGNCKGLK